MYRFRSHATLMLAPPRDSRPFWEILSSQQPHLTVPMSAHHALIPDTEVSPVGPNRNEAISWTSELRQRNVCLAALWNPEAVGHHRLLAGKQQQST